MNEPIFKLSRVPNAPVTKEELIADLQRVGRESETDSVTIALYKTLGNYNERTVERKFGGWNKALTQAGLKISNRIDISDSELFENILKLWQHYGRQPRRAELAQSPSLISQLRSCLKTHPSQARALKGHGFKPCPFKTSSF